MQRGNTAKKKTVPLIEVFINSDEKAHLSLCNVLKLLDCIDDHLIKMNLNLGNSFLDFREVGSVSMNLLKLDIKMAT